MYSKADYGSEAIGVAWGHVGWTFARGLWAPIFLLLVFFSLEV